MEEPVFKNEKFEATGETKQWLGKTLHRIRAVADIAAIGIAARTLGGWIEREDNLAVSGNAWVSDNARVSGNALVYGNARVSGNARVYGNARVSDNALVYGNAWVHGDAWVYDNARVYGNAAVYGDARVSATNLTAVRSDGYTFSVTASPDGPRVIAGCRYFSFEQAREHWRSTRGGTLLGDETFDILELLEKQAIRHGLIEPVKGGDV